MFFFTSVHHQKRLHSPNILCKKKKKEGRFVSDFLVALEGLGDCGQYFGGLIDFRAMIGAKLFGCFGGKERIWLIFVWRGLFRVKLWRITPN